ncbi:hypothetical protein H8S90_05020 [Olivibacter sp. SDN3]|uniref:DUF6364 family protein n=1 Tax=Olivibacter sp. SDN3 TaxID=2764720 RepID=UPI001650E571|nr:DUF6364 family protein [Olivibacter sp. SDN3]QNL50955.1 hypothetical protein H8S90_05020 [Olivibacter sp. SDN3]
MKAKLNLSIDKQLLTQAKAYAAQKHSSVSELVENYFKTFVNKPSKKGIVQLIESLPKPEIADQEDLKKRYLEDNAKKYGF